MNPIEQYIKERDDRVKKNLIGENWRKLQVALWGFNDHLVRTNYVKNFTWQGIPIMQLPTDMFAIQELICKVRPDVLIETGIAFGGSLLFYQSVMPWGKIIGVDIDIREHAQKALEGSGIHLVCGDSAEDETFEKVKAYAHNKKAMVVLDSHHTHNHVLRELNMYSSLVTVGSYIIVMDTTIEQMFVRQPEDRPWGPGNNPYTAVREFLKHDDDFVIDREAEMRALLTSAADGYLRRVK